MINKQSATGNMKLRIASIFQKFDWPLDATLEMVGSKGIWNHRFCGCLKNFFPEFFINFQFQ